MNRAAVFALQGFLFLGNEHLERPAQRVVQLLVGLEMKPDFIFVNLRAENGFGLGVNVVFDSASQDF